MTGLLKVSLAAFVAFWTLGQAVPTAGETAPGQAPEDFEVRMLFAPYWSTERGLGTVILINNPAAEPVGATLWVYSSKGRELAKQEIELEPVGSVSVSLSELAPGEQSGHLALAVPARLEMVPAQAVISSGGDGWVVDFEDQRNLTPERRRVVAPIPDSLLLGGPGEGARSFCVLTNVGDAPVSGSATIGAAGREARRTFHLAARETRLLELSPGLVSGVPARLIVETESQAPGLLVTGYTRLRDGRPMPLHFSTGDSGSGGELASFYGGQSSRLLLGNDSAEEAPVVVSSKSFDGIERSTEVTLAPDSVESLDLTALLDLGQDERGAVLVSTMEGARVYGAVYNTSALGNLDSSGLKDTRHETNVAYSLGVRLGHGFTSKLDVFNPNGGEVEMCLFLYFGDLRYTYPLKRLGAGEGASIDLLRARDEGLPGEEGNVIPADAESGQAKVIMHKSGEEKNLVVVGRYENLADGTGATFQGCFTCPPTLWSVDLVPDFFDGFVGESDDYDVFAFFSDGSFKNVTTSSYTTSGTTNSSVASAFFGHLSYNSPGLTSLFAEYEGCAQYGSSFGGKGRLQCECDVPDYGYDQAPVHVDPPNITISGPASILVGEPEVQLTTQMMPSGGTVSNWRVVNGDSFCLSLSSTGGVIGRAPGTLGVQVDYTVGSTTVSSPVFNLTISPTTQYVRIDYSPAADNILAVHFNAGQITDIKNRVISDLQSRYSGVNVVFSAPVAPVTRFSTLTITGNSPGTQGGQADYDRTNYLRTNSGSVYLGTGSLDLASSADPVPGGINERLSMDRVADAIALLTAHEIAHMLGLVPTSGELTDGSVFAQLAAKLQVTGLGLNGTSSHHNPSSSAAYIMRASAVLSSTATWNVSQYTFEGKESTYLSRVLP